MFIYTPGRSGRLGFRGGNFVLMLAQLPFERPLSGGATVHHNCHLCLVCVAKSQLLINLQSTFSKLSINFQFKTVNHKP